MGMLIDGQWVTEDRASDKSGRFVRQHTQFRNWITADGSSGFPAEAGRYHLYVAMACPWAHRTLILRQLKRLDHAISLSVVDPFMGVDGWAFSENTDCIPDPIHHATFLREIYVHARPDFTGRVTVPILWDKQTGTIVNNESAEIIRMFDTTCDAIGDASVNFYPAALHEHIDATIQDLYHRVNNGVYRAGFARSQAAYDEAVSDVFAALDHYEAVLSTQRYVCGSALTEADWCFFPTLIRFDLVYHGHFKCNIRRITDYPNLWNYLKDLYQVPGVAQTCHFAHIKQHYYQSHESVNPSRIVPSGPALDFHASHDRQRFAHA